MEKDHDKDLPHVSSDDAYWDALFRQEEAGFLTTPPADDAWAPLSDRVDGRFRWSDAGQSDAQSPWQLAHEIMESDQILQLRVIGYNKGGLLVRWHDIQGFVPASQLVDFPQFHVERERIQALSQWQDRVLKLKVIEVNDASNRLILSERAAQVRAEDRDTLFSELEQGAVVSGYVTNLTDFGAFVDLGGVEGLIHISELSWSRVVHPSDIVKPGDHIDVLVLNVDRHSERIALSMKRLKHDPWSTAEERYRPGQMVTGVVSNVASFGAFVWLEEELEGLIHISELAEGSFLHPRNVVRKGDRVTARVLHVDSRKKRLALSMRNTSAPGTPESDAPSS